MFCFYIQNVTVDLTSDALDFKANGVGGRGRNDYSFNVEFYLPINEKVKWCINDILFL